MDTVAEFMEERPNLVVFQKRRFGRGRRREVTKEGSHRVASLSVGGSETLKLLAGSGLRG